MRNEAEELREAYRGASGDLINALQQAQKDYGHDWVREVEKIMEAMEMADAGTLEEID